MKRILFFLVVFGGFFSIGQAKVIDSLVECHAPSYEGVLEVVRPHSDVIDPTQEGSNQLTQISTLISDLKIDPIVIDHPVIQSKVSPLFPNSYFSVNLTTDSKSQLVLVSILSNNRTYVSYKTLINQPTHLFVIDMDNNQKQDIIVGKTVVENGVVTLYYQILLNKTRDADDNNNPVLPVFDTLQPVKQLQYTQDKTELPTDWIVSQISQHPFFTILFPYYSSASELYVDENISAGNFFGLGDDYTRITTQVLNVDSEHSDLSQFSFLSLYQKEGEDNFLMFENVDAVPNRIQNTSLFDELDDYTRRGYQMTHLYLPPLFTGEIAVSLVNPQESTQFIVFLSLNQFDLSANQFHWTVTGATAVDTIPRIVCKSISSGRQWFLITDNEGLTVITL